MSSSKDKISQEIQTLITNRYTLPPKKFAEEELAVRQTIEKLVHVLRQPAKQKSLLPEVAIESIINMTRLGHLTVIAKELDDNFLVAIEEIMQKGSFTMEYDGEMIDLVNLYNQCKTELTKNGKAPNFEDVLLRMYSVESPFYKKLNAVVCGYNKPQSTTDEEVKMAFLLNIAIHKAGLMKRMFEIHQTPEILYRGQSFGLPIFEKKFSRVKELSTNGQLASLPPEQLPEINIVDIVAKKNVSMSSDVGRASGFANGGIVLHVRNPAQLADFYAVANVSAHPNEAEYLSRMPDDIAMIPVDMTTDSVANITHIHVMCIHSQNTQLYNSTRLIDMRAYLKNYIKDEMNDPVYGFFWSSKNFGSEPGDPFGASNFYDSKNYTQYQKLLLGQLMQAIENSETHPLLDIAMQDEFLETTVIIIKKLYETNPTNHQKKSFDAINAHFQDYSAAVAGLDVMQKANANLIIASEQKKLAKSLDGKRLWLATITTSAESRQLIAPIEKEMESLLRLNNDSLVEMRKTADKIIELLKANPNIGAYYKVLESSINGIIESIDKIVAQQFILDRQRFIVNVGKQQDDNENLSVENSLRKTF